MKTTVTIIIACLVLNSCIVSTAAKVVTTAGKIAVGTVKTAVKGVGWAYAKANGKINVNRLDHKWKVIGIYAGDFEQFKNTEDPINLFLCNNGDETYEFKVRREKMYRTKCGSTSEEKYNFKYSFEKNSDTKERENLIAYGPGYFNVINVTGDNLVLEGYFSVDGGAPVKSVCLLEKAK